MGVVAKILAKKSRQAVGRIKYAFSAAPEKDSKEYPLGLHLNAILRFDPTDFILAGQELKIELPSGDMAVMAIGEFRAGIQYYRFYLKDLSNREWVLQVADGKDGTEAVVYQTLDEVYPDDWDFWLNKETGLIGYKDFHTPDQSEYYRVFKNPGPDYANPIEFREQIRSDVEPLFVNHAMMLYSREVVTSGDEKLTEYLLVSREEDQEGALVRIMAGVPITPMSLTVL